MPQQFQVRLFSPSALTPKHSGVARAFYQRAGCERTFHALGIAAARHIDLSYYVLTSQQRQGKFACTDRMSH